MCHFLVRGTSLHSLAVESVTPPSWSVSLHLAAQRLVIQLVHRAFKAFFSPSIGIFSFLSQWDRSLHSVTVTSMSGSNHEGEEVLEIPRNWWFHGKTTIQNSCTLPVEVLCFSLCMLSIQAFLFILPWYVPSGLGMSLCSLSHPCNELLLAQSVSSGLVHCNRLWAQMITWVLLAYIRDWWWNEKEKEKGRKIKQTWTETGKKIKKNISHNKWHGFL